MGMGWSKERLVEVARERLGGAKLVVVSNREPYLHLRRNDDIECVRPPGGLVTALDPVMRAVGGLWVAHGSGDADRLMTDAHGRVAVPPDKPAYMLRRVWLSKREEQGYYYGAANDALWPLCHIAYTRPHFDDDDWEQYKKVNRKFADAVLDEIDDEPAVVFVQDYHFALLPRMLKTARPDLVVMQFWHIPWPNPEVFRICPWQEEILDGLLGNDLLTFHIQYHCNNFLDAIDCTLEAKLEREHFAVVRGGATTLVRAQPIGIDPDEMIPVDPEAAKLDEKRLRKRFHLGDRKLIVGVDRLDYTKGIPDRILAVDRLLRHHPELKGTFTFLQIAAPSRTHLPTYRHLNQEVVSLAEHVNWQHGDNDWQPIEFINEQYTSAQINPLYRMADVCLVSSLHDGMNLVAKEFVAARTDQRGVLILSRFAGAARELADALLINPFAVDQFADALHAALTMPEEEQERRMTRMRTQVANNNVYRWAGMQLSEAAKLLDAKLATTPIPNGHTNGASRPHAVEAAAAEPVELAAV
jgi:trehalose 6-phosphate synthase